MLIASVFVVLGHSHPRSIIYERYFILFVIKVRKYNYHIKTILVILPVFILKLCTIKIFGEGSHLMFYMDNYKILSF